jgi:hypothetical protein
VDEPTSVPVFAENITGQRRHIMPLRDREEEVKPTVQPEQRPSFIVTDADKARKRSRLRLMKERNEAYLAEQKDYEDEEFTQELRVFSTK